MNENAQVSPLGFAADAVATATATSTVPTVATTAVPAGECPRDLAGALRAHRRGNGLASMIERRTRRLRLAVLLLVAAIGLAALDILVPWRWRLG